jgi:hypothetical protein
MGMDIRYPIGLMFSILGLLLTVVGLSTLNNTEIYQRSLGVNVNLWSGLIMVVFGAFMLIMAYRARKKEQ